MILRQARVWFSALSLCRAYLVKIDGAPFPSDGPGSPRSDVGPSSGYSYQPDGATLPRHCAANCAVVVSASSRSGQVRTESRSGGFWRETVKFGVIREVLIRPWQVQQTAAFSLSATSPHEKAKYTMANDLRGSGCPYCCVVPEIVPAKSRNPARIDGACTIGPTAHVHWIFLRVINPASPYTSRDFSARAPVHFRAHVWVGDRHRGENSIAHAVRDRQRSENPLSSPATAGVQALRQLRRNNLERRAAAHRADRQRTRAPDRGTTHTRSCRHETDDDC
jgi:hypothetical protein